MSRLLVLLETADPGSLLSAVVHQLHPLTEPAGGEAGRSVVCGVVELAAGLAGPEALAACLLGRASQAESFTPGGLLAAVTSPEWSIVEASQSNYAICGQFLSLPNGGPGERETAVPQPLSDPLSEEEIGELLETLTTRIDSSLVRLRRGFGDVFLLTLSGDIAEELFTAETRTAQPGHFGGHGLVDAFPRGPGSSLLDTWMTVCHGALADHPVNLNRRRNGLPEADCAWVWGPGRVLMPKPAETTPSRGSWLTTSPWIRGLARVNGWSEIAISDFPPQSNDLEVLEKLRQALSPAAVASAEGFLAVALPEILSKQLASWVASSWAGRCQAPLLVAAWPSGGLWPRSQPTAVSIAWFPGPGQQLPVFPSTQPAIQAPIQPTDSRPPRFSLETLMGSWLDEIPS